MTVWGVLIGFGLGVGAGATLVGSAWCFWYAGKLRLLRKAEEYSALARLTQKPNSSVDTGP